MPAPMLQRDQSPDDLLARTVDLQEQARAFHTRARNIQREAMIRNVMVVGAIIIGIAAIGALYGLFFGSPSSP
jgi:F0F1-type ATP synthase assembly protein I